MQKKKTVRKIPVQCFVISFLDRLSLGAINKKLYVQVPDMSGFFAQK